MNHVQDDGVKEFLVGIQLEQFYWQVRNKLHVSQLSHFDHVNETDLDSLGMAKPEQRRLSDALKKARKKSLFSSFRRKVTIVSYYVVYRPKRNSDSVKVGAYSKLYYSFLRLASDVDLI